MIVSSVCLENMYTTVYQYNFIKMRRGFMILRKILLPIFGISYFLFSSASEEIKKPEADKICQQSATDGFAGKRLTGQIFRYPWFVGRSRNALPESYSSEKIILNEEDTWFNVWATSPESENWGAHGHPNLLEKFPRTLPLKLFLKEDKTLKTDGDVVQLTHTDQHNKIVTQIVLTIQQRGHRGDRYGTFVECLRASEDYESLIKPYINQ